MKRIATSEIYVHSPVHKNVPLPPCPITEFLKLNSSGICNMGSGILLIFGVKVGATLKYKIHTMKHKNCTTPKLIKTHKQWNTVYNNRSMQ